MRVPAIFVLTLVLAVGIAVLSPRSAITPGTLAHGHQEIAGDCLACHAPFRGTPDARCTSCHAADSIGLARAEPVPGWNPRPGLAGLHRSLTATDCVACHMSCASVLSETKPSQRVDQVEQAVPSEGHAYSRLLVPSIDRPNWVAFS